MGEEGVQYVKPSVSGVWIFLGTAQSLITHINWVC